jgi:hypothetical protein
MSSMSNVESESEGKVMLFLKKIFDKNDVISFVRRLLAIHFVAFCLFIALPMLAGHTLLSSIVHHFLGTSILMFFTCTALYGIAHLQFFRERLILDPLSNHSMIIRGYGPFKQTKIINSNHIDSIMHVSEENGQDSDYEVIVKIGSASYYVKYSDSRDVIKAKGAVTSLLG